MKWNFELDVLQNQQRWRDEQARRFADGTNTGYDALSSEEQAHCRRLNEALTEIERNVAVQVRELRRTLSARVADPSDWLDAFAIVLEVSFVLRGDDPESVENDDNVLCIREHSATNAPGDRDMDIGGGHVYNWESHSGTRASTRAGEKHCRLYHDLYDQSGVDWRDILRIGKVWIDLKATHQQQITWLDDVG